MRGSMKVFTWLLTLFLFTTSLFAGIVEQDAVFAKLQQGQPICADNALELMSGSIGKDSARGRSEWVDVEAAPGFTKAMRVTTAQRQTNPWSLQTTVKNMYEVKKGDAMLAVFYARAVTPGANGMAQSAFIFELGREPYEKSGNLGFEVSAQWTKFYAPMESKADYAAGEALVHFHAGYDPQAVEIGGLQLLNYGRQVGVRDLPFTPHTYQGREAAAPWRQEAAQRIEQIRKGDLTVIVRNASGEAVPGVRVAVRMQKHAYGFGSAVAGEMLFKMGPDAEMYREVIARSFNKVVLENDLKWDGFDHNPKRAKDSVQWLRDAGMAVRGHCLLWPGWKNLPKDLATLPAEALRKRILDHVREEVGAFKGQLVEWDVVNEPFTNTDVQKVLGEGILADVFKLAHETDPKPVLFINDYSILSHGGTDQAHQDHYFNTIRTLLAAGAPVQGIGMQGHFNEQLTPPPRLWKVLDRFAALGLPIQVTEMDINVWEDDTQADYTRDLMTAVFAHPSTIGILTWGFWEGRHWIPSAASWRKDWLLRPAGKAWYDMVFREWWTSADMETDASGTVKVRGFLGDYTIEVKAGDKTAKQPASLVKAGSRVEVTL